MTLIPKTLEEHQEELRNWERQLRENGWEKTERNLWKDPDRPNKEMSLRTAYYTMLRKGGRKTVTIQK